MDPFTMAVIATVAGAAVNQKAAQDAQRRQNEEIRRSLENQRRYQLEAEQKALTTAKSFDMAGRAKTQENIAQEIEASLLSPVSESQAIRSEQQATKGDVSTDYATAKTASDIETAKQAQKLAKLLGKTTSAGRLRMDESFRMLDAGQDIDRIANFARGTAGADNIAIEQAGRVNPKMVFLGSLLSTAGQAGMIYSGMGGGVEQMAVNSTPTIAASPGMAPVYDVARTGATYPGAGFGFARAFR